MTSLAERLREQCRLVVLQTLSACGDYRLHEYLLLERVRDLGLGTTRDQLRAALAWLAEQGLVSLETIEEAAVPRLTARGQDVAEGLATVPGVARPRA
jgi:Fe2+ or Zn2+ uptake regulation protein